MSTSIKKPTYSVAPPEYICNVCGHREPIGRTNNVGRTEGSAPMLRHLRDAHGYEPKMPIRDWQEHVDVPYRPLTESDKPSNPSM